MLFSKLLFDELLSDKPYRYKYQQKAPSAKLTDAQQSKFRDKLNVSHKKPSVFKKSQIYREKPFRHYTHNISF